MNGCSTFLSRQLRFIQKDKSVKFLTYMKTAQDFFYARQDYPCYHLVTAKIYLYKFLHTKTNKQYYWCGYLYHKTMFFELTK